MAARAREGAEAEARGGESEGCPERGETRRTRRVAVMREGVDVKS